MANQIKKTQDIIRENGKILKDIKKQWIITEEQQKKLAEVMSSDEVVEYVSQKKKKTQDAIKQTRNDWKKTEWFQTTVKTRKEDIALIKQVAEKMDVSFEEAYNMLHGGDELKKKVSDKKESKETWKITHEHLLNKPNMTAKDKEGMQKSIDYLIEKKMDTSENLKKLDAIVYTAESIEVGGVKRARKDITAKPNGKNIFQHNNVTYFKRSESMIKEQNDLLAKQWMEIPLDSAYEKSMRALPGEYSKTNRYEWWNILSFITDMSMDGCCVSDGALSYEGEYGCRWSASPGDDSYARGFRFSEDGGVLNRDYRDDALPVRPVLK